MSGLEKRRAAPARTERRIYGVGGSLYWVMAILNAQVTGYFVAVSMFSQSDLERTIHVQLEGDLVAEIRFVQVQPAVWVSFEEFAVVVALPLRFFDDMYRVLQTEAPVFFVARAEEDPVLFFTSLRTAREAVGEGPTDAGALI